MVRTDHTILWSPVSGYANLSPSVALREEGCWWPSNNKNQIWRVVRLVWRRYSGDPQVGTRQLGGKLAWARDWGESFGAKEQHCCFNSGLVRAIPRRCPSSLQFISGVSDCFYSNPEESGTRSTVLAVAGGGGWMGKRRADWPSGQLPSRPLARSQTVPAKSHKSALSTCCSEGGVQ